MKKCLVVDDSKVVRKICSDIVKGLGFETAEAGNGQEALDFCKKEKPTLILLDWNMPIMTGIEFLAEFRKLQGNEQTKVIVCTTENEIDKIQTAISTGADEYIMKPFDAEIVKDKLLQIGLS